MALVMLLPTAHFMHICESPRARFLMHQDYQRELINQVVMAAIIWRTATPYDAPRHALWVWKQEGIRHLTYRGLIMRIPSSSAGKTKSTCEK